METRSSKHSLSAREQRLAKRHRGCPPEAPEEPREDAIPAYLESVRLKVTSVTGLPAALVRLITAYHIYPLQGVVEHAITVRKHTAVNVIRNLGDGRVVCSNCEALRVLNVHSGEFEMVTRKRFQGDIVVLPKGEIGVTSENDFMIFNAQGQVRRTLPDVWSWFCNFILLPEGRLLGAQACGVKTWHLETGECEQTLVQPDIVLSLAVLDEARLAVGCRDFRARIWSTGKCLAELQHPDEVTCLVPVSRGLVSAAGDGSLRLWDLGSFVCLHVLQSASVGVTGLVVLPGNRLASSSQSGAIKVWDLASGYQEHILQAGQTYPVVRLYPLLDGRLMSSSEDSILRVWDVSSGLCDVTLNAESPVVSMAQLPNGRVVCGTRAGRILVWT